MAESNLPANDLDVPGGSYYYYPPRLTGYLIAVFPNQLSWSDRDWDEYWRGIPMKCPRCWAEKAYLRPAHGWKTALLSCLLFRPMKCHHCYHKFHVHWLLTLGKRVEPPILRVTRTSQPTVPGVPVRRDVSPNHFDDQQHRADAA